MSCLRQSPPVSTPGLRRPVTGRRAARSYFLAQHSGQHSREDSDEARTIFGASGGIGAAFCDALDQQGYAVTGLSRSGDGLDLRDPAAVDAAMAGLSGPFDLVVIATGILAPPGASPEKSLRSIDPAAMQDLLLVNAVGPALILSRLPALLPREGRGGRRADGTGRLDR